MSILLALASIPSGCTPHEQVDLDDELPTSSSLGELAVTDVAIEANFQGARRYGHFNRGRTALVGDLDGDGLQDLALGNPSDPSYALINRSEPGTLRFVDGPELAGNMLAWGGGLADLDNDGDNDLLFTGGGNEGPSHSRMWNNRLSETGWLDLQDVTEITGIAGPLDEAGEPMELAQAHAVLADFDRDGTLDIFVNVMITPLPAIDRLLDKPGVGHNVLWIGSPGGYVEVSRQAGLDSTEATQNSVGLDFDRDGDVDIYENDINSEQHLWRNLLVETGELAFEDVRRELSLGDGDLRYPLSAFTSAADDFNNDGWEDILVFVRAFEPEDSPYTGGHVLLLNVEGRGFVDVAPWTGVNDPFVNWELDTFRDHTGGGVMGATVGDVNGDGIPDVYVGQGGPTRGTADLLFLSTGTSAVDVPGVGELVIPQYEDASSLVDYPAAVDPEVGGLEYPPYPYRTHAVNFVDYDRDGVLEISVQNGGPADEPDVVREPNRLFRFEPAVRPRWLAVELTGNGTTSNRSAIGARVELTVSRSVDGASWRRTRWLHGGNGFCANNGLELYFGLADADRIDAMTVTWPDGTETKVPAPIEIDQLVRVEQPPGEVRDVEVPHRN